MNWKKGFGILACLGLLSGGLHAQVIEKKTLTLEGAKKAIAAAVAEAKRLNAPGAAIAVVDDGGNILAVERLDNTFAAGALISVGKARTATLFKKPTSVFEEIIKKGRTPMVALNDFTPLQGGIPIMVDDQVVGAIGVSGAASAQQDEELAMAGAKAVSDPQAMSAMDVSYFESKVVSAAFEKGAPLTEVLNYKVHASHREGPGMAEIHVRDTDIVYVLEGSAVFVTGGTVVDPQTTAPDEIRGKSVQGGQTRRITKGDVIIVPNGTPHWFKEVNGPINYYVVKVTS